jgi:hypothetical protein
MIPDHSSSMQQRMKKLFTEGFSVMDIVEPLPLVESCQLAGDALTIVERTRLPLLGVMEAGRITGYLRLEDISEGECGAAARPFGDMTVLDETASLPAAFEALAGSPYCFVRVAGEVRAIVGRMDIQKAPVRMWLFGMVTIIEMFLSRIITDAYPGNGWREVLTKNRLKRAEHLQHERSRRGEGVRLIDCLQLSDKANIVMKDPELFSKLRFESKRSAQRAVKEFESLRNNLAHSHDLVLNWDTILEISKEIDIIVTRI